MQDDFLLCETLFRQRGVDCPQNERALFDRKRQAKPDTVAVKLRRTDRTDPVKLPPFRKQQQRAGGEGDVRHG